MFLRARGTPLLAHCSMCRCSFARHARAFMLSCDHPALMPALHWRRVNKPSASRWRLLCGPRRNYGTGAHRAHPLAPTVTMLAIVRAAEGGAQARVDGLVARAALRVHLADMLRQGAARFSWRASEGATKATGTRSTPHRPRAPPPARRNCLRHRRVPHGAPD